MFYLIRKHIQKKIIDLWIYFTCDHTCHCRIEFLFNRENPDYVLEHLQNNPETTSLYVAVNGEEIIGYQSEVVRPLASTVKIIVAIEYALQINDRQLEKDQMVPLDHLDRYYLKGTDGGAHEEWLVDMKESGKLKNNQVSLHEVAKGMMLYSSNANTDYLMDILGVDNINQRIDELGLKRNMKRSIRLLAHS